MRGRLFYPDPPIYSNSRKWRTEDDICASRERGRKSKVGSGEGQGLLFVRMLKPSNRTLHPKDK